MVHASEIQQLAVLRLAAEVLGLMEGAQAIDSQRRKTVTELISRGRLTIDETLPQRVAVNSRA